MMVSPGAIMTPVLPTSTSLAGHMSQERGWGVEVSWTPPALSAAGSCRQSMSKTLTAMLEVLAVFVDEMQARAIPKGGWTFELCQCCTVPG